MADTSPARPRPWLRSEATLTTPPHRLTQLQGHLTQRWPDTSILTHAPRQSRSDRRHSTAPLASLTEGQRRLRHSDCSATRQSESDRQSGLAKGATANSAPPDPRARTPPWPLPNNLRLARPRSSGSASAMEDRLDLSFGGAPTSPGLGRGPATSTGSAIITLPRADSGRREQDRCPIWLAPPDRR